MSSVKKFKPAQINFTFILVHFSVHMLYKKDAKKFLN